MNQRSSRKTRSMENKVVKDLPSFFKILIGDFKSVLRLPQLFVKKFGDVLPEKALLQTKYGESWSIKIEKIGEDYCFTHGWPLFVKYHRLEMCDLLLFSPMPDGKLVFGVKMYGRSACEKELTFLTTCNSPSNSYPENTVIDLENTCSPSTSNTVQGTAEGNSSKSSWMMKRESNSNRAEFSDDDFVTERSRRFVVSLKIHNKYRMAVPIKFARVNGITAKKTLRLVNSKGETWPVGVVQRRPPGNNVLELVRGWSEFWKENRLIVGRRCALEFIPGSDCFRVQLLGSD